MRLATWNVNSLRSRIGRVEAFCARQDVDVLAMQETKCSDDQFPTMPFAALGYEVPDPPGDFPTWPAFLAAQGVPEEEMNRASALEDPDGEGPRVFFQQVPEPKAAKNRLHLDLRVVDVASGRVVHSNAVRGTASRFSADIDAFISIGRSYLALPGVISYLDRTPLHAAMLKMVTLAVSEVGDAARDGAAAQPAVAR